MKAIAIVGPTGGGKTALSLSLAKALDGEILCCDSMQIYRHMDIGTAKPTPEEQAICPHHLVDIVDPHTSFSAADYTTLAMDAVRDITARGKCPIFCGGTGLYLDAVRTLRHESEAPGADPVFRAALQEKCHTEEGRQELYASLEKIDPEAARATHPNNTRRVIRALEIHHLTGKTKTQLDLEASRKNPDLDLLIIGLFYESRDLLYSRIDSRVDAMLEDGLLEETKRLLEDGLFEKNATAAAAIGYKELTTYLSGTCSLEEAIDALKTASRRYAKRQMTYFKGMEGLIPLMADVSGEQKPLDVLTQEALSYIQPFLQN